MLVRDLGTLPYRDAWSLQEQIHAQVLDGETEQLLLLEHPPVITFGRRPGIDRNIITPSDQLEKLGVEIVPSDRGGDVTFHGPGQLVAYPILRLADHHLSVGAYVHLLEDVMIDTLRHFNIQAHKDPAAIGVWVAPTNATQPAKIGAIGVRVRRGVTMHGLALNITTDLNFFSLIIPCGLTGRPVASLQQLLGSQTPSMPQVKRVLADSLQKQLDARANQAGVPKPSSPIPATR